RVTLRNIGQQAAAGVTGQLLESDPYVSVTVPGASFGAIPSGATATSAAPFVFAVAADVPDLHALSFQLTLSEAPGSHDLAFVAHAPALDLIALTIDDSAGGDGDGIPEPGEAIALGLTLRNEGSAGVAGVSGILLGGGFVAVDPTPRDFGALEPGATASAGPFALSIDPACPPIHALPMALLLSGSGGYAASEGFIFQVGEIFRDDVEGGAGGWSHYAGGGGFGDQWHLETYRNHTYGGTTSWKCGGAGSANYNNLLYAILESTPFSLPDNAQLTFWHWMHAEVSSSYPGYCYDGGLVEISIDGGPWQGLAPEGGYPYRIRAGGTPGPFPAETPVFSGSHDWRRETFDLSGHQGSARIRFAFGSDGSVAREGWYVDDAEVTLQFSAVSGEGAVSRLELFPAGPNPAPGASTLRFALPRETQARLGVYDAAGRLVRPLHEGPLGAGAHALSWDGRGENGAPVAAGVYWLRLKTEGEERSARVVIVR
ncbi:MAG: T9SS type A sorting domain-containing protein, partial [Candidatus Eisenbacteria bacterium]|nr:T9SS type A sorting domain-containing protein [Candidatus Eisenbacteria bacterium]